MLCKGVGGRLMMPAVTMVLAGLAGPANAQDKPPSRVNSLGMKFVKLPKGTCYTGGGGYEVGRQTVIKEDFEIAIHTVTQGQWQAVMGDNPSYFSRTDRGKNAVKNIPDEDLTQFPVESVSWGDAQEFIEKLNIRERGKGCTYRLPSKDEWEYACRGGATSEEECCFRFYVDKPTNDLSPAQANFGEGPKGTRLERPTKVGSYQPNKAGLYDMHGNVWQWCSDRAGYGMVTRGGSWNSGVKSCSASYGHQLPYFSALNDLGFRLVAVPVVPSPKHSTLDDRTSTLPPSR